MLMRLPNKIPTVVARRMEVFTGLKQQWGLVAKWEFDVGCTPHGLVERIIASCHAIGNVVGGTCWRKGACFKGNDAGQRAGDGSYALMVNFCEKNEGENIRTAGTLTIQAFGARDGRAVWGAMRFAIFTVWRLFDLFPGLSWQSWFECPADVGRISHNLPGPGEQVGGSARCMVDWHVRSCVSFVERWDPPPFISVHGGAKVSISSSFAVDIVFHRFVRLTHVWYPRRHPQPDTLYLMYAHCLVSCSGRVALSLFKRLVF